MRLPEGIDAISRRRFLSLLAASMALTAGSSCSRIDRGKIVPYTRKPARGIPGVSAFYASTFQEGLAIQGVLVRTREGRPIHLEGNPEHADSRGMLSLRATGDLLGLYDPDRLGLPVHKGVRSNWQDATKALNNVLSDARLMDKRVLLLTGASASPSLKALLYDLRLALPGLRHVAWEPAAPVAQLAAARALFGKPMISRPDLRRADVILSFQSDFLGVEPDAPVLINDFASRRGVSTPTDPMNRLWVVEGHMTLTGANADERIQARPSRMTSLAFALARLLHREHSLPLPAGLDPAELDYFDLDRVSAASSVKASTMRLLARDLVRAGQSGVVLAGAPLPMEAHAACHLLNFMLGSEKHIMDRAQPFDLAGNVELKEILEQAARGEFAVGIFWGANPAYAFPDPALWKRAINGIPETFRIGLYEDETALDCAWRLPEHHWLESWGDFESPGFIGIRQPVSGPLHNTRQAEDLLLACLRGMRIQTQSTYLEYLKARWRSGVYVPGMPVPFESFWNSALHDGGVRRDSAQQASLQLNPEPLRKALESVRAEADSGGLELVLAPAAGVHDGRYSNNGWLNELPDPVTKATWSNPLLISPADAERLGLKDEDVVTVSSGTATVDAPVLVQPGQASGVAGIALGYGRRTGNVALAIGANAYQLLKGLTGDSFVIRSARISRSNSRSAIPRTQDHHRMEGRDLARSWALAEYAKKVDGGKTHHAHTASLIPEQKFPGQKWGMAVDLSKCVGCSSCVIGCQSENNIPVVGPERVLMGREMHWIRIDRYYEGDQQSPSVRHQPMFCQQCDDAPCEIVCPVNATTHSPDGLNQMTYNRCVGTRYCSNNCPFKVRRFNFFDYTSTKKEPETLVFNPEVTVRPRGVMEKCTFCIQRIQDAKQNAKHEARQVRDGEITPACVAACPSGAIVFGDLNDPESAVSKVSKLDRHYRLLEELGIKPSVTYLADIANPVAAEDKA